MHSVLAPLLKGREERYPHNLEKNYSRIFNQIMELWGKDELDRYFSELFLADRPERQGFPFEVMREIGFLQELNDEAKRVQEEKADAWANEQTRRGLESEGIEYSPRGFFRAVETGNVRAVQLFVEAGVDINQRNDKGWTPLMVAIFSSNEAAASLLMDAGARADIQDQRGYGPLHWAAYRGYVSVTKRLIQSGVPPDLKSHAGITPLLQAAAMGHADTAQILLEAGAHPSEPDNEGWTPLHKAIANGHEMVVEILMKAGADPTARHAGGATPIGIAREKGKTEILALLAGKAGF